MGPSLTPQVALGHPIPLGDLSQCQLLLSPGCHLGRQQAAAATQAPCPRHPGPRAPCQGQGQPRGAAQLTLFCWGAPRVPPLHLPVPCPPLPGVGVSPPPALGVLGVRAHPAAPCAKGVGLGCSPRPFRDLYQFGFFNKSEICFSLQPSLELVSLSLPVVVLDPHCSSPSCPCPCPPLSPLTPRVTPAPGDSEGGRLHPPLMSLTGDRSLGGWVVTGVRSNTI